MASFESPIEFAPVGVVRAAAWPIESLHGFGDSNLAALASASDSSCRHAWNLYVQAYEQTLECERRRLWSLTAEDPWFMKALLLSNPSVAGRVRRCAQKRHGKRSKSIRHLENVLYRYLARGAGRTTPHGLWAGVGRVELRRGEPPVPAVARYSFSPDLRPFQAILRSLAGRSCYRTRTLLQPNPTLVRQPDGRWSYWARTADGQVERRELENHEWVDLLIDAAAKIGSGTYEQILAAAYSSPVDCSSSTSVHRSMLQDLLDLLSQGGVFLGGLDLPNRFTDAWDALSSVEQCLISKDRLAWNRTVHELGGLCESLSIGIKEMSLTSFEAHLERAASSVNQLAEALEISLPVSRNPALHCDLSLPLLLELDNEQRAVLLQSLQSYETGWINGMSPIVDFRIEQRTQVEKHIEPGLKLGDFKLEGRRTPRSTIRVWSDLMAQSKPAARVRLAAWERLVSSEQAEALFEISPGFLPTPMAQPPLGCFYVGVFENFQLVLHGVGDNPVGTFTRNFKLLELNALQLWLRQLLNDLRKRHGIEFAELQGPFEDNPNVLARPDFGVVPIELWGNGAIAEPLIGGRLIVDPTTHLPLLRLPSIDKPIAVFWFSAADIASGDPISAALLCSSFQESFSFGIRACTIPVQAEVDRPRFSPRIRLPEGAIMRPRRTVLTGSALENLAKASAAERYARWQRLASQFQWPALLNLQRDDEPALLMHRDSPLAIESLFKGVRDHIESLIIEELVGTPWLVDDDGCHHMADVALPFSRKKHGWSSRIENATDCATRAASGQSGATM